MQDYSRLTNRGPTPRAHQAEWSMTIFAGIAEFERTLIISRTSDGRVAAKARGGDVWPAKENAPGPAATGQRTCPRRGSRSAPSPGPSTSTRRRFTASSTDSRLMLLFCSSQPHRPGTMSVANTRRGGWDFAAGLAAERLTDHLRRSGFIVMRARSGRPHSAG